MKKVKSDKPINFLFVSIGNKSHLFEHFRAAFNSLGVSGKIVAVDIDPYCPGLYLADKGYMVPRMDSKKFSAYLSKIIVEEKISLIIPTRDEDVVYLSKNRRRFEKFGTKIMAPSYKTAAICNDKWKFYKFLKAKNLKPIETWRKPPKNLRFPCILKPIVGAAGVGVEIIKNKNELEKRKLAGKIIQEKIEGVEYSIDYFSDFSGKPISTIPRIRVKVVGGESKVSITKNEKEIIALTKKIGRVLGLVGQNTLQCFKTKDGKILFLEANPSRFGGAAPLSIAAGGNSPEFLIRLLVGEKVPELTSFKTNLVMMRYNKDLFVPHEKIINL